jgi:hypothetical protein
MDKKTSNSLHRLLNQKRRSAFLIVFLVAILSIQAVYTTSAQDFPNKQNLTQYENSYLGIRLSYPPGGEEPVGFEEGCFENYGCSISIDPKVGHLNIYAYSLDDYDFSKHCNCDTLAEYVSYEYELFQQGSEALYGTGNFTLLNDNQTTIGNNYPAQQYEYSTPAKFKGYAVTSCDNTIIKHYGILTKVDNTFYNIEYYSCAKPQVYATFFPEVMKIFHSIDFLPAQDIESTVTPSNTDNLFLDQTSGSGSLQILSHNSFTDILGFLHVVGEVKNNSPTQVEFVKVIATFYDSNNEVVGTKTTYTNPSDISGGDTAPFEILLTSASIPISEIDNYKLAASYQ